VRRVRGPADANGEPTDWYEYELDLTLAEDSPAGWSALEAEARDRSARAGALRAAASLGYELPAPYERAPRLYALGWRTPEADAVEMGIEIGRDVAGTPPKGSLRVIAAPPTGEISGVVVPSMAGFRPGPGCDERAASADDSMPVLHEVDVLVVGGGTAGAAAGIAAARAGAKTLVIEPQEALGGLGTVGLITKPWYGLSVGFAAETPFDPGPGGAERKAEWLRGELSGAGGEVWFGSFAFAALLEENTVIGAAVSTPWGHGAVLAGVVVDATGNADLAAAAGCETLDGANRDDVAVQGAGLALRLPGADYSNSDFLLVDESDVVDVSRAALGAVLTREPAEAFDVVPLVQSRERRRIRGAHVMRYLDQILGRTYPDTVVVSHSDYDSHGYPSDLYFALLPHDEQTRRKNHPAPHPSRPIETPYRCLLPQGVENLLVAGLGISMHRDAAALVRMQPDILNQGYAAGLAAVRAVRDDVFVRDIDVAALQRDLAEAGNLPDEVLDAADSFPLSEERIRESVRVWRDPDASYEDRSLAMAAIFTRPGVAIPLLRDGLGGASGEEAVELAKLLGVLGQDDGAGVLAEALDATAFDPKILQGRMAEYAHLPTPVDALILALGYGGADGALPSILRKLEALDAGVHLSHHRAVALALEALGAPQAAAPLAGLLQKPGMSGHEMLRPEPLHDEPGKRRREGALREVVLARALLRCGDDDGLGRAILERYRHDLRGHLARHAALVLDMDAREG
jgi:hypothetical protein